MTKKKKTKNAFTASGRKCVPDIKIKVDHSDIKTSLFDGWYWGEGSDLLAKALEVERREAGVLALEEFFKDADMQLAYDSPDIWLSALEGSIGHELSAKVAFPNMVAKLLEDLSYEEKDEDDVTQQATLWVLCLENQVIRIRNALEKRRKK